MNPEAQKKIEAYLKKASFSKVTGKDVYISGKVPNMRVCDLTKEPPWCGISVGASRQEAEECGIAQVMVFKNDILAIYNSSTDIKKPAEQGNKTPSSDHPEEEPPKSAPLSEQAAVRPDSAGESHTTSPYFCVDCKASITAEQRSTSVKEHGHALCEKCITAPKPEPDTERVKVAKNQPEPKKEEKKPMVKKEEEKGVNVPAVQPKGEAAKLSDHEIEERINREKARRFARGQGDFYKVSGKERPDSAMIQKLANETGISVEILEAVQTEKFAHVVVRGHLGAQYLDAVVHHDFETEFMLRTMEIVQKNPQILERYDGTTPVLKEGAKIKMWEDGKEVQKDAKYYLVHALLSFKKFALRDCCTKSSAIVQLKLLNQDARDEEEIKSEQAERELVEKSKGMKLGRTDDRFNADYPGAKC